MYIQYIIYFNKNFHLNINFYIYYLYDYNYSKYYNYVIKKNIFVTSQSVQKFKTNTEQF